MCIFPIFNVLFYRFTTTASFCFWRNLKVFKIPNKIRISDFFVSLTSIFIVSPLLHRKICECPLWSLRVIFRPLGVVFGLKEVILGLGDPIFYALGVIYIAYLEYWEWGDLHQYFWKIIVMILCHFSIFIKLWIFCALYLHWLTKTRARFPALRMKAKASGNRFWTCRRQFCELEVDFWPLKSLGIFKSIVWSLGLEFGPLRFNIEPLEVYFWP